MQPSSAHILSSVRRTLAERVAPRLAGTDAEALLAPLEVALGELARRLSDGGESAASEVGTNALLARGRALLGEGGVLGTGPSALADILAALQDRQKEQSNETWFNDASALIEDTVRAQYEAAFPPQPAVETSPPDRDAAIDPERLANQISVHLAAGAPVSIEEMRALSGGYSRDTMLVKWSGAGQSGEIVLRRQKLDGMLDGIGLSVAAEYPLLELARDGGVPVPAPLWLETDIASGGPYIAMERARGSVIGSAISAVAADDAQLRQVAQTIARLHNLRWEERADQIAPLFGLPASGLTSRIAAEELLDQWTRFWAAQNLDPSPALTAAFNWLRNHIPESTARPCVLHGDIGFHNMLFDDGEVTALLDWETAFLGDPAKDMAICEAFVRRYADWSKFVEWYHEAGGPHFDAKTMRFYHVLRVFSYLLVSEMGWQTCFADQAHPKIEAMFLGGPIRQHFFTDYLTYLPIISGSDRAAS